MKSGICPKCHAENVRRTTIPLLERGKTIIELGGFRYCRLANYICGHCGYHESYVEIPGDLQAVIDCSERVSVTAK